MLNMMQFEEKYQNEMKAIAKKESVSLMDARGMLIYSCRLKEKGIHSVGEVMDFGKALDKDFDYITCLADFREAIGLMEIPSAA